jgi:HemY protein
MARIEGEAGDKGRVREWLGRAVNAARDPAWTADGVVAEHWAPTSPATGGLDAFHWRVPVETLERSDDDLLARKIEELVLLGAPQEPLIEAAPARPPTPASQKQAEPLTRAAPEQAEPRASAGPAPRSTAGNGKDQSGTEKPPLAAARTDRDAESPPAASGRPPQTVAPDVVIVPPARAEPTVALPPPSDRTKRTGTDSGVPQKPILPLPRLPDDPGSDAEEEEGRPPPRAARTAQEARR